MQQQSRISRKPEGYVEILIVGDQTEATFKHLYYEILPIIEEVQTEGKPLLGLIDMTHETGYSLSSDKAALEVLESINYDKLAMCNPPHKAVTEGIILAAGKSHNTKIFDNREAALAWLLSN